NALMPKLASVKLEVKATAPGLEVKVDDEVIARERWDEPLPLDPGEHNVTATAPARTPWSGTTTAAAGVTAALEIPELVDPNPPPLLTPTPVVLRPPPPPP